MAKSAKGAAAAKLINEATAAQGCYVFGELADCQGVREVRVRVRVTEADDE